MAPILFIGITALVRQSYEEMFVDQIRQIGRITADRFESHFEELSDTAIVNLLDSVAFQDSAFAEFVENDKYLMSSFSNEILSSKVKEDFNFGGNNDDTYRISIPIDTANRSAVLHLGFDEQPMNARIYAAQSQIALIFFIFIAGGILLLILLTTIVTRPLRQLQKASEEVATGKDHSMIVIDSTIIEIKNLSQNLQQINDLRKKLLHSQKLETMGTFSGGMAHELNNILLPMRLYSDMAIEQLSGDNQARQDIEKLIGAIGRASDLVSKILAFSHQQSPSNHTVIEIRPVIEDALQLIQAVLPPTITLTYVWKAGNLKLSGDEFEIHQIVMNLCTNAYKAMSSDGGTLTVEAESINLDRESVKDYSPDLAFGQYICLRISDTGPGIDPLTVEHIFEPFFTTRGVGEGVGLGLSVVHGIVLRHNGSISARCEPNSGATFEVLLPEYTDNAEL